MPDNGAVVAAVCHGPAALVDVRLGDGSALVAGRHMTGFTNEEEALFGKKWAAEFPWLLEDALRARGALWSESPLMMPGLVVDGRLVTGQNPYSTPAVAEAIVRGLGRTPVARTLWRDEQSMALVERLRRGELDAATAALAQAPGQFHVELIGILGYYQAQAAGDDAAQLRPALQPYGNNKSPGSPTGTPPQRRTGVWVSMPRRGVWYFRYWKRRRAWNRLRHSFNGSTADECAHPLCGCW